MVVLRGEGGEREGGKKLESRGLFLLISFRRQRIGQYLRSGTVPQLAAARGGGESALCVIEKHSSDASSKHGE